LAEAPFDWDLVRFASASLSEGMKTRTVEGLLLSPLLPRPWQKRIRDRFFTNTRLDTPARAAAAGFWYLHKKKQRKLQKPLQ
jgi:hypothetical protein